MSRENLSINNNKSGFNYQMCVLSAIAIIFVIFGHIYKGSNAIGTFYNWFPYYSFHLPIFLFISGYFHKDPADKTPDGMGCFLSSFGKVFLKKVKTLLIPYFVINGIFLLLNTWFQTWGFTYGTPFSFTEWLIHPWTQYYSITYALPTWYLIGFFIADIYFIVLRKLVKLLLRKETVCEIVLIILTLAIGIGAVYFKNTSHPSTAATVYLRSAAMLFFMEFGCIYRKYLEKLDRLSSVWYFILLFAIQLLVIIISGNGPLSPGLYNLGNFESSIYDYFVAGTMGLLLWLRVARIIASLPRKNRLLIYIGNNTKYLMAFHIFGFFLLNGIFRYLCRWGLKFNLIQDFDDRMYQTYLYYFVEHQRAIILYFFAGLGFSLLFAKIIELVKRGITYKSRR